MPEIVFLAAFLDLLTLLESVLANDLASLSLTMPQLKVLALVLATESPTVSAIAQALHVTPPTASGIIDRLEQKHLVVREDNESDRRVVHVRLSVPQEQLLSRFFPQTAQLLRSAVDRLEPEERRTVERAARLLLAALADLRPSTAPADQVESSQLEAPA
ncbi:MAG: MarR family transcriptional regulator [Chloroflexi bacterium]|nr:MarR family transcriptional regulator [Chloroflexota bacterium]